ncbi:hypothetical protein ACFE04_030187 [Oxalis oulophora]
MTLKLRIDLKKGRRVVVDFEGLSPFGNAAGLLGAACGLIATDYNYFSISFKSWGDVPDSYFDNAWNNMFEVVLETLEGALKEVAALKSIIKKLVPVAEFEKALREKIQTVGVEDWAVKLVLTGIDCGCWEEDDDSSDGSNGA